MLISTNYNQISHKRISPAIFNKGSSKLSARYLKSSCEYIGHLLGQTPASVEKIIEGADVSRVELLKALARKYNMRNAELPIAKRESKDNLFQIYNEIIKPQPEHFDVLRRTQDGFDSIRTIFTLAKDEKGLDFVSKLQRDVLINEKNQSNIIIGLLNSKHKIMFMEDINKYKSYLKLNAGNSKAVDELDKSIDKGHFDGNKYDSKIAIKRFMKFKTFRDFIKPFETVLVKNYNLYNGRFLWQLTNNMWHKDVKPFSVAKKDILGLYKTTNKDNVDLRLAVLNSFNRYSKRNNKSEVEELNKLFDNIEKNNDVKQFVINSVEQGLAVDTIGELNSIINSTNLKKANYFFENVRRIVALSDGEERQHALISELDNPFFTPKQPRTTRVYGIRDEVRDYGVFGKAQRYLVNKFKVFLYNHFSTNESASAQEEQKTIKRLKIKKLAQENKIKLTNDVNEIIKNKLGSRVYNEQEDLFRLKATKIRLSLLPEIFDSIKITRAQYRKQGIEPNVSNKNAARLYELINGSNRKIIRYMLKISDNEGNRIFNVNQIIEFIEKANKDICDAKSMKPDYKASDTKAYYNNLFDELNAKYGKLKRDSKTKK